MKEVIDACGQMEQALAAIKKAATKYTGEKVADNQDGNHGNSIDGEESYSNDFDNLAKKQLLKQKMLTEG